MNRSCQVCPMRAAGYKLDYHDPGSDIHLGHYRVRYSGKSGNFYLWVQHMCAQCKYDGNVIARLNLSAKTLTTHVNN